MMHDVYPGGIPEKLGEGGGCVAKFLKPLPSSDQILLFFPFQTRPNIRCAISDLLPLQANIPKYTKCTQFKPNFTNKPIPDQNC